MKKLAVVLFNLGGPDRPEAVKPFLFNLFRDPAIISLPGAARWPLAALIATTRARSARANYALMGGASPLLPQTKAQAEALEAMLRIRAPDIEVRCFVAMRYWTPFSKETAAAVAAYGPDEIVLTPLYPQYSTTTTASSMKAWREAYEGPGRSRRICCYPALDGLVKAHADAIREVWIRAGRPTNVRLLFSAHGLPGRLVDDGDPYQAQIEATAGAIGAWLPELPDRQVCYQSRVGRLKWLEPSTAAEIRRAARDGKGVLIAPIAFVSEHVETLVELDHDYAALAKAVGCSPYLRASTPGIAPAFIESLADGVLAALHREEETAPHGPWRCPAGLDKCALRSGNRA